MMLGRQSVQFRFSLRANGEDRFPSVQTPTVEGLARLTTLHERVNKALTTGRQLVGKLDGYKIVREDIQLGSDWPYVSVEAELEGSADRVDGAQVSAGKRLGTPVSEEE